MAEFENRLACVIKADGTIARGYMIDRCEVTGDNGYTITWKIPLVGPAKTNFSATIGSAEDEPVEPASSRSGSRRIPTRCRCTPTMRAAGPHGGRFTSPVSATSSASPAAEDMARGRPLAMVLLRLATVGLSFRQRAERRDVSGPGWKSERMVRRYAAVTDATLRAAAEAVSGAGSGNGGWKMEP